MKTLVIDDDSFALKVLGAQLRQLGCDAVHGFDEPHGALAFLREDVERVSLVFSDLQMPGMDGVEFVRHLARLGFAGGLVFVSSEDERVLHAARRLAEAHGIRILGALAKPVATDLLRQVMEASKGVRGPLAARPGRCTAEDLAHALERGELFNVYQPKVDLATGRVTGVEALVRWNHPRQGVVMPDQFIGLAEEHGLIHDLTLVLLGQALRDAYQWKRAGLAVDVAVNVSMADMAALDFPDVLAGIADEARVPLSSLTLEVTESRVWSDIRAALEILTRMRLKGIRLSIDDFGTGHSSLAQLRDIPFNELKLDRGFVSGAVRDSSLRAIVDSTIDLAHGLRMTTVAEGIEDEAHWRLLGGLGCDMAQGTFISRPMPASQIFKWKADWDVRARQLVGHDASGAASAPIAA